MPCQLDNDIAFTQTGARSLARLPRAPGLQTQLFFCASVRIGDRRPRLCAEGLTSVVLPDRALILPSARLRHANGKVFVGTLCERPSPSALWRLACGTNDAREVDGFLDGLAIKFDDHVTGFHTGFSAGDHSQPHAPAHLCGLPVQYRRRFLVTAS